MGVALVVVAGLLAAGATSVILLRGYLLGRTDDRLLAAEATIEEALAGRDEPVFQDARLRVLAEATASDLAIHLVSGGEVVESIAAQGAVAAAPDPAELAALDGRPGWLTGPAGRLRALAVGTSGLRVESADGSVLPVDTVVLVRDVGDDARTVERLALIEASVGAAVAAAAVVLVWLAVGGGLRPLSRMARAAERIAAGDASARIPQTPAPAETRALAAALDAALDERARAERRLRDFVADAAHELRTPLTSVHGWADLYLQGGLPAGEVDGAMERIARQTSRMRHLVDQLALLARLDAEVPLRAEPVDLAGVVDEVVADLDVLAPEHPVSRGEAGAPVLVVGERERLVQVVANLVGNVLRHTPPGTGFAVSVTRAGERVRLVVHDEGPGVPEELAPRVFERFVRQTGQGGGALREGSGLGLAIVAEIVRAHGGTVALRSAPGEGTTVSVELPAAG